MITVRILLVAGLLGPIEAPPALPDDSDSGDAEVALRIVHTALDHTEPADGDTLAASPPAVEIHFTGPIEEAGRFLSLTGPDGSSRELETTLPGGAATILAAEIPMLTRGGYRVAWRVVSPDGHPLEGQFVFFVEGPEPTPPSTAEPEASGPGPEMVPPPSQLEESSFGPSWLSLFSGAATGLNVTLLALAGLLAFGAWGPGAPGKTSLKSSLVVGLGAAVFAPLYAWLWVGQALPGTEGAMGRLDGLLSLRAGQAIAAQSALIWIAVWVFAVMQRIGTAAALSLAAVGVGAASGHALGNATVVSLPSNALHLLAVSAWFGGLLFLFTERRSPNHQEVVLRVSSVALVASLVVLATGLIQSWLHLGGELGALTDTTYGNLVLLKGAGFLVLVLFGAFNRFKLIPAAQHSDDTSALSRSVRLELVAAGAVLLVASVLAHTSPPA